MQLFNSENRLCKPLRVRHGHLRQRSRLSEIFSRYLFLLAPLVYFSQTEHPYWSSSNFAGKCIQVQDDVNKGTTELLFEIRLIV